MEFLPLRATCKGYARNHAFQELLQVTNPWKALKAAREGCVSIEQLQAENFRVEDKDRKRIKVYSRTGFCCPADRRLFNRCGPTMPGEQHKYFVTYKAESFESSQRERNYRIRRDYPDRRYHDVQTFFWGLGILDEIFTKQEKQESCSVFWKVSRYFLEHVIQSDKHVHFFHKKLTLNAAAHYGLANTNQVLSHNEP